MARKNYTVEQIIVKLREVELHLIKGNRSLKPVEGLESLSNHFTVGGKNTVEWPAPRKSSPPKKRENDKL